MSHATLEQQRARDAWEKAQGCRNDYRNLAKGLPALIMNSGLMQVLAFLYEKGRKNAQHKQLGDDLRAWLHSRFAAELKLPGTEFGPFMQALMHAEPRLFQRVTSEAMAWLRWMRQMAAAACVDKEV